MATPTRGRQLIDGVWQNVTFDESPSGGGLPAGGSTGEVLTKESNADGDAGWEPAGGSSAVLSASAALTNAQIKALPGTDIQLIAAPGSGKMIIPLVAYLIADFAVAYGGIDADTEYPAVWVAHKTSPIYLAEFVNNPGTDNVEAAQAGLTAFLTGTNEFGTVLWNLFPIHPLLTVTVTPSTGIGSGSTTSGGGGGSPADYEDVSFKIGADNSINFTGGDAANTLNVTVLYTVLDV